ncbi:hypothetical protein D3P08_21645 [Paenibacillus nanensis]|uniref:Uncharacterized protein n=1 Tax=Paenibacillus nanensis TaxID=393251 RepID=A0A3A1UPH8_9BACL|nr:hypothetical protein D3P08_21645 [Paenibacillus nanensis]
MSRRRFVRKIVQSGASMRVEGEFCAKNRAKWGESVAGGGVLYEKSYKLERKCGRRRSFVRNIVQRGAKVWLAAKVCTKNRTKWGESECRGGDLYDKSYKEARMHVEVQICTKYRTKRSESVAGGGVLYEKSYKEERKCG